jgi:phosphate uptake regulator
MFSFFRRPDSLAEIETSIIEMLDEVHSIFDKACDAAFGGGRSKETGSEVRTADDRVEEIRRDVIRRLTVHESVTGLSDLSDAFTYLLVTRDAERASDYAKNVYDLAKYGFDLSVMSGAKEMERDRGRVTAIIEAATEAFREGDPDAGRLVVEDAMAASDDFDAAVRHAATGSLPPDEAVAKALFYRYLKRLTAHLAALASSTYVPVDRIDDQTDELPD